MKFGEKIYKKFKDCPRMPFIILSMVYLVLMGFLALIPILFDFRAVSKLGKAFMIVGSIAFLSIKILIAILGEIVFKHKTEKNKKEIEEFRGYYLGSTVHFLYLLCSYINYEIWGTLPYYLGIMVLEFLIAGIYFLVNLFSPIFNNEKVPMAIFSLALFLLYISCFSVFDSNTSMILIKVAVGVCYLVILSLLINAVIYEKGNKFASKHRILSMFLFIIISLLVLLTIPYYVGWWGLSEKEYDTFVSVYAALLGGGLTLIGVAWTIIKSDISRRDDELKQYKPIFNIVTEGALESYLIDVKRFVENSEFSFSTHLNYQYCVNDFCLCNTDFCAFYLKGIKLNEVLINLTTDIYIEKNLVYNFNFSEQTLYFTDKITEMYLIVEDLLGNLYKSKILFEYLEESVATLISDANVQKTNNPIKYISIKDLMRVENM